MSVSILIIDDNEMDRYILRRNLAKCSFDVSVIEASDGQAGLDYFYKNQQQDPDSDGYPPIIVFLDINMPRINGFQFLEHFNSIRDETKLASTVIVMFTSSPRQEDMDQSFQWEFVKDFVVKGDFTTEDLDQVILSLAQSQTLLGIKPSAA